MTGPNDTALPHEERATDDTPTEVTPASEPHEALPEAATEPEPCLSWRLAGASVVGTSHLARNQPCQDAHALHLDPDTGTLVLVASDGAGSARHAELGSTLACQSFLTEATALPPGPPTPDEALALALRVRDHLHSEASQRELRPRDLACTLLGVIVAAWGSLYVQVGDGAIVAGGPDPLEPVFWPSTGEYVNETHFLTDAEPRHVQHAVHPELPERLALFTDGLQSIALRLASREAHAPFLNPLFSTLLAQPEGQEHAFEVALAGFLGSEPVNARTDDDRTLVLAARIVPTTP